METQQILAFVLVAVVFGIVGYGAQVMKVNDLGYQLDTQESNIELLKSDVVAISAISEGLKADVANKVRELDSKNAEIESKDSDLLAKQSVIESKETALQDSITKRELAEQRATELEKKFEVIKQEEVETARLEGTVVFDDLELNKEADKTIDGYDTDKLYDGKISFDGDTYYVRETVGVKVKPATSLLDNEFSETVYLTNEENSVYYQYTFETPVKNDAVCDDKDPNCNKDPFTINFLGKRMDIVEISGNEIKTKEGDLKYIKLGETVTYNENAVTITTLGTDFVYVDVDGVTGYVKEGHTKTINSLDVYLSSTGTVAGFEGAVVVLGSDIYQTYKHDSYDFADDFLFTIGYNTATDELESLKLTYEPERLYLDNDEGFTPLAKGEVINFLDYFNVVYNGVTEVDSTIYTMSFKDYNSSVDKTIRIKTTDNIIRIGNDRVNQFYFDKKTVYYKDANDVRKQAKLTDVTLKNGESETTIKSTKFCSTDYHIDFTTTDGTKTDTIRANTRNYKSLLKPETANPKDVVYMTVYTKLGTKDNSIVTNYGTIVDNPETNSENDKVVLNIPDKQVTAEFVIS